MLPKCYPHFAQMSSSWQVTKKSIFFSCSLVWWIKVLKLQVFWCCQQMNFMQQFLRLYITKPPQGQAQSLQRVFHFHPPAFQRQLFKQLCMKRLKTNVIISKCENSDCTSGSIENDFIENLRILWKTKAHVFHAKTRMLKKQTKNFRESITQTRLLLSQNNYCEWSSFAHFHIGNSLTFEYK